MNSKSQTMVNYKTNLLNGTSWLFGLAVLAVGLLNSFWGNDLGFGIFLILLSFVYFPPANDFIKEKTGFSIPLIIKVLLGIFIIVASLGVGELFYKIELMMMDL